MNSAISVCRDDKIVAEGDSNALIASRRSLESSPTGRLALSLYPHDPSGRRFMILNAYYDESGTHGGSPVTVLAGIVGSVDAFVPFDREWKKVLSKYGLEYVHAKHLVHRQGMFKGWTEQRRWRLECDLMYVLQEHKNIFVNRAALFEDDYLTFYKGKRPEKRERLDSRYALCFRAFLHFLPVYHRRTFVDGQVNFILEAGHRNAGDALRVFNEMKSDRSFPHRNGLGAISFDTKASFPALQAADMFAYFYFQCASEHHDEEGRELWASGIELDLLRSDIMTVSHDITPDDMINHRMNFYLREKRPVFTTVRMHVEPQHFNIVDDDRFMPEYVLAPPRSVRLLGFGS